MAAIDARRTRGARVFAGLAAVQLVAIAALIVEWVAYVWPGSVRSLLGDLLGNDSSHALALLHVVDSSLVVLALAALAAWLIKGRGERERARRQSAEISSAIERLNIGVAVWDENERLAACNAAYRTLYPGIAPQLVPGTTYLDVTRAYFAVAPKDVIAGRTLEQFLADASAVRAAGPVSEIARNVGDRWLLMTDVQIPDGGAISFRVDVTDQRLFDLEMQKRRRALEELGDLTGDWFWRTDAEGRFAEFSSTMQNRVRYTEAQLLGKRREEIPGFEADPAELDAHKQLVGRQRPFPWLHYRARRGDGTTIWIAVAGKPLFDDGGRFQGYYGAGRDTSEMAAVNDSLRRSEERFHSLAELATEWYWETDSRLRFSLIQGPPGEKEELEPKLIGKPIQYLGEHANFEFDWPQILTHIERREPFRRVLFHVHRTMAGTPGYFEVSAIPVFDGAVFTGYRGLCWDVTERESLIEKIRDSEARFRSLTALSSDWYWEMDAALRFTRLETGGSGRQASDPGEDIIGQLRWELPAEIVQPATWEEHKAVLLNRQPFRDLILRRRLADGKTVYHATSGDPVFGAEGEFRGYRGVGKDITQQVRSQERIERLATTDPLTQMPNRQTFDERAGRLLVNAYAGGNTCAMLFIDLDNFSLLNNGYGHRVGDQVLTRVAGRMREIVAEPHLLGRRGGDELVVLLADIAHKNVAEDIAQRLIRKISEPMAILGMELSVTASIGISYFPQDGVDLESLLNAADAAMYQAKENGGETFVPFSSALARRIDLRVRLEQRLRKALEARDFRLVYQPIVSFPDGKIIGAEALLRWKDAELGEILPAEFIAIAEESGLIVPLGDWVLREACRSRQVWSKLGLEIPPTAVNISAKQLRNIGFVERVLETLAEFEVLPSDLEFEVTETTLLESSAVSLENLMRLSNAGVKIALDDFGVGYSSLSHLRDLPIHRLKIDKSFTIECMRNARTLTIVKAVIEMARSLGITVTAEGIETHAQQTWMQHLGCASAQGFLFARPMAADEFLRHFLDSRGVGRERSLMH